jgi:hypothetical protein
MVRADDQLSFDRGGNGRAALIEWACGAVNACYKLPTGRFYLKGK